MNRHENDESAGGPARAVQVSATPFDAPGACDGAFDPRPARQSGDDEVLATLDVRFRRRLMVFFRNRHVQSDIVDCVQETFARVIKQSRTGPPIENLAAFVMATAKLVAFEALRGQQRARQSEQLFEEISYGDVKSHQETALVRNARLHSWVHALNLLRRLDRSIVVRVVVHEEDRGQLCRELGLSRRVLAVRLHRALRRLERVLGDECRTTLS